MKKFEELSDNEKMFIILEIFTSRILRKRYLGTLNYYQLCCLYSSINNYYKLRKKCHYCKKICNINKCKFYKKYYDLF